LFLTYFKKEKTKEKFLKKLYKIDLSSLFSLFRENKNFSFFLNLRELKNFTQRPALSLALKQWLSENTSWASLSQAYNAEFKIFSEGENLLLALRLVNFLEFTREWRKSLVSTSLEPSLAYLMCFLSKISYSDAFLDPTCGSGTIVIERAFAGHCKRIIGSDVDKRAIKYAKNNIKSAKKKIEIYQWDAQNLPLKKNSITRVVANLPYGQRVGSHQSNLSFYPLFFKELNRIISSKGRVVLLTQEKKLLNDCIKKNKNFLIEQKLTVDIGNIQPDIFVLKKA